MNILETIELHTLSGRTVVGAGDTAGKRSSVGAAFLWGQIDPKDGNKYVCKEKKSS